MNMDISCLKDAGLTDGEIKVYLALLECGLSTSGTIVEKSTVARSIIYQILEKLMQKGLVSTITKEKTKWYQAASPKKLLEYMNEKEKKLEENKKQVKSLLPQLLLKQKESVKSQTTMYFGFKGIRTAHEHTYEKLKKGECYYYLGVPAYQPEEQHIYWQKDHIRRIEAGIKCKLLFNKDTPNSIIANRKKYKEAEVRRMTAEMTTPGMIVIFKDTTIIMLQNPHAIAVEIINQDIANSFMEYFNEFWKRSS
jgi:sugar-specific transcriptional regulator TrmB